MSPGIDSEESIPPGWESTPGLVIRVTNAGSVPSLLKYEKRGGL
jgi:hypothetical protein